MMTQYDTVFECMYKCRVAGGDILCMMKTELCLFLVDDIFNIFFREISSTLIKQYAKEHKNK